MSTQEEQQAVSRDEWYGRQGDYAFPVPDAHISGGMSLRDYFAGQAIIGIVSFDDSKHTFECASRAYDIADAMIQARSK